MQQKEIIDNNKHYWDENAVYGLAQLHFPHMALNSFLKMICIFLRMFLGQRCWKYAVAVAIHSNILQIEMRLNYGELTCPRSS